MKADGSNASANVSGLLKNRIGPQSPGTNDRVCFASACSQYSSLPELQNTSAPASYVESEFHDWNNGYSWLNQDGFNNPIGLQVAAGVADYYGF